MLPYLWLLLFFLAPFMIILKISFADPVVAQPPFTALLQWGQQGFEGIRATFENYLFLFEDSYYGIIYLASLKMAAIGTLLCLLLGYPMAYFIARQPTAPPPDPAARRHPAVLDLVPVARVCLDRPAEQQGRDQQLPA